MNVVSVKSRDLVGHATGPPLCTVRLGQVNLWAIQNFRLYLQCDLVR